MAKKRSKNHRSHESGAMAVPNAVPQPPAQSPAPTPAVQADEVRLLREALQAERSARAALELRLHSLEFELQQARRPKEAPAAGRLTPEDLGFATLHQAAAPAKPSADDYAFFESWVMEANMRADAELAAHAAPAAPMLIPIIGEMAPTAADTSIAQERLLRKLNSAREALETAEAKAAHNAAQVKKLTAELASARAEHMRATTRLRSLEVRLAQAEGVAETSASMAAKASFEAPAPPAPAASEHPFAALEELPPIHPPVEKAESLQIEDALAAWGADPGTTPASAASTPEPEPASIEDALAAWGAGAPTPAAPQRSNPVTGLEDALAAWGAGDTTPATSSTPADPSDDTAGLQDALAAWGAMGEAIPTPPDSLTNTPATPFAEAPRAQVDSLPMLDAEDTPEDLEEEPAAARMPAQAPGADALAMWDADTEPAGEGPLGSQDQELHIALPEEGSAKDEPDAVASPDAEDEIAFLEAADRSIEAADNAPTAILDDEDAAQDLVFEDEVAAPAPGAINESTTAIREDAPAQEFVLDLDEVLPEDALDIDFDAPGTVDNLSSDDTNQALEDALAEVFGESEAADAASEPQEDATPEDIEILDEEDTLPAPEAAVDEDVPPVISEDTDFTPEAATPPQADGDDVLDELAAAYRNHHREDEREALLARPVRIMEAGRHHAAPKRSVAASLEGWSGFGEQTTRRAEPRPAEPAMPVSEETALDTAEDSGGKATMVDALLRFMRPK